MTICEFRGIAVIDKRPGTNEYGYFKGKESCINVKFGRCTKHYSFTKQFKKKHAKFVADYEKLWSDKADDYAYDRGFMQEIWRQIIKLCHKKELVVYYNICDGQFLDGYGVALYAMQQTDFDFTWSELDVFDDKPTIDDVYFVVK